MTNDSKLVIYAKKCSKILRYYGDPIKEEVVAYGLFVMNSMEKIQQMTENSVLWQLNNHKFIDRTNEKLMAIPNRVRERLALLFYLK
jgi:hypothetical protein